jgi:hypothetical protein
VTNKIEFIALMLATVGIAVGGWYLYDTRKDEKLRNSLNYKMNQFMFDKMVTQDLESRINE